jgi:hypothetical protein
VGPAILLSDAISMRIEKLKSHRSAKSPTYIACVNTPLMRNKRMNANIKVNLYHYSYLGSSLLESFTYEGYKLVCLVIFFVYFV